MPVLLVSLLLFFFTRVFGEIPAAPLPIHAAGLTNAFRLSTNIYSGAAPDGDAGFQSLVKLGIRTVLSVDGLKPDVERAHKFGLKYIHIPHGYDGIDRATQAKLVKASELAAGPIYVHCHHGQHRGPASAAVICLAENGWNKAEALEWLKLAGTSTNYPGLFRTVERFEPPRPELLARTPNTFPEVAQIEALAEAMVAIDQQCDRITDLLNRTAPETSDRDTDLHAEMILLSEHFREAQRLPEAQERGDDFLARLKAVEEKSSGIAKQTAVSGLNRGERFDRGFAELRKSCASCHKAYRNKPLAER